MGLINCYRHSNLGFTGFARFLGDILDCRNRKLKISAKTKRSDPKTEIQKCLPYKEQYWSYCGSLLNLRWRNSPKVLVEYFAGFFSSRSSGRGPIMASWGGAQKTAHDIWVRSLFTRLLWRTLLYFPLLSTYNYYFISFALSKSYAPSLPCFERQ